MGRQVALVPLLDQKTSKSKIFTAMSADLNTPLFKISDGGNVEYEDDPTITQMKANLVVAEHVQQERAEQRRLEREEQKVWVEAARLMREIEEVERKRREIKEAELERLTWEKEKLEEEKRVKQQHAVTLWGGREGGRAEMSGVSGFTT